MKPLINPISIRNSNIFSKKRSLWKNTSVLVFGSLYDKVTGSIIIRRCCDVTWVRWRLDSPATQLFFNRTLKLINKYNTKSRHQCPPVTGGFPSQGVSKCEKVFVSWRHPIDGPQQIQYRKPNIPLKSTVPAISTITHLEEISSQKGVTIPLLWRHNGHDNVSNHQPHDWLLNRLFRRKSRKTSKLRVTGLCAGNSPGIGEFPAQKANNAENVFIWWRHHAQM